MTLLHWLFYAFAVTAVSSGVMVITVRNPVRCVLFLVLAFFASAGIWMLLHAEFLALILVLVYVGAVMTLFLFVVMMLSVHLERTREGLVRYFPLGIVIIGMVFAIIVFVISPERVEAPVSAASQAVDYSNIADLGMVLYTDYVFPFEIAAVLLLTAIVASISLTHRSTKNRRMQNPAAQIAVRREDRVRLLKMPSEKKNKPSGET